MRLAFVTPEYPTESPGVGGLAQYVRRVARALATRGHDVTVLVYSRGRGSSADGGVRVLRVPARRWARATDAVTFGAIEELTIHADFSRSVCDALAALHRERPIDLVQFPNLHAAGLRTLRRLPIPHVVRLSILQSVWNRQARAIGPGPWLATIPERRYLRQARHLLAPSRWLAEQARAEGLNVTVIPSPVWLEASEPDTSAVDALGGRPYALYFGRFELTKGFHVLADALPAFLRAEPDAVAVLAGRDVATVRAWSMHRWLLRRCDAFRDRIVVLPPLPHTALYPLIAGARVVALPSLVENLSNALLEAAMLGACVVATRGTSAEEVLEDGVSGLLVPPGDAASLAGGLIEAWRHPDRAGIGAAARRRAGAFAPDVVIPALEAYYREVIAT